MILEETVWMYRPPAGAPMRCLKSYQSEAYRMGYRDCTPAMRQAADAQGLPPTAVGPGPDATKPIYPRTRRR